MVVSNGVLHDFPLLATVNRALRLSEGNGQDTRFDELSASLAIARGTATTDDLVIQAGHLRAVLSGQIGFDRSRICGGVRSSLRSESRPASAACTSLPALQGRRNRGVPDDYWFARCTEIRCRCGKRHPRGPGRRIEEAPGGCSSKAYLDSFSLSPARAPERMPERP